ncbi:hypothetical protein KFZ58_01575 [Virgibacillus sp. NKC19-16]|uniref:hypothetical protein n=1 Tax=Virgibacillus salidurans TaxID=2831673 RepID=UPI001F19C3E6|nr:hypothetical protein [Virgibacillus sp. NKC19-16]UJL46677.1 hypothetical protein KFZ58_01575 [Virgibacillus sp. NKC19-16]
MSAEHFYGVCQRYKGRAVEIKTHDGRAHRGIIKHVDNRSVYLQPFGGKRNLGGFGYGYYGPGYGYGGGGFGYGLALGAIGTLALLPLFYW